MPFIFFPQAYMPYDVINAFFCYSFLGWAMECVVIRREKGVWENRGFVHAPFCIIYGFGAMLGYVFLRPFSGNLVLLAVVGAALATVLEYLTARLMLRLFGTLWWDYSEKRYNYKGILCLESSIGWGAIAVLLFTVLHHWMFFAVTRIPRMIAPALAAFLVCWYVVDFILSVRKAMLHHMHAHAHAQVCAEDETDFLPQ